MERNRGCAEGLAGINAEKEEKRIDSVFYEEMESGLQLHTKSSAPLQMSAATLLVISGNAGHAPAPSPARAVTLQTSLL